MSKLEGAGSIKGGLPVIAVFDCGYDSFCGEFYAEIKSIYWRRKNGSKGKQIPDKVFDEALKYDDGFSNLLEMLSYDYHSRNEDQ